MRKIQNQSERAEKDVTAKGGGSAPNEDKYIIYRILEHPNENDK